MRIVALLIAVSLSLLLCVAAVCQDAPPPAPDSPAEAVDSVPAPPPAPEVTAPAPMPAPGPAITPWLLRRGNPYVIVGPSDSQSKPKAIRGKISIIAKLAANVNVASVAVLVDGRFVGSASGDKMGLYGLEFDSNSLTEGVHTVKAVGADAMGKQTWTATTTIDVRNKQAAATKTGTLTLPPRPVKPTPVVKVTPIAGPAKTAPVARPLPRSKAVVPAVKPIASTNTHGAYEQVVSVGPMDNQGTPRQVSGTVRVVAKPPAGKNVVTVRFSWDNKMFHEDADAWVEVNTLTVHNGLHTIKAVGKDMGNKEVWTAHTRVEVANGKAAVVNPIRPNEQVAMHSALAKTFTSAKYGFSIRYAAGWVAKDKTSAMRPKKAGNGWIEFSPANSAGLAVNVRRMRLDPGTTAAVFAKFNPYVTEWDRRTLLGAEAFSTNTDTGNRIIHRLIIIKGGLAWMLNCVDGAGKTSNAGQRLFDSMVASFSVPAKP